MKYPETRRVDQTDDTTAQGRRSVSLAGSTMSASRRKSPPGCSEENAVARAYLDAIPQRGRNCKRLTELWNYERYSPPRRRRPASISIRRTTACRISPCCTSPISYDGRRPRADRPQHVVEGRHGRARRHRPSATMANCSPTPSEAGSDWQQIYVMEIATGKEARRPFEVVRFSERRLDQGRQRLLLQPLSRAEAGRKVSASALEPDGLLPQARHEAGGRQARLQPAGPSRLELRRRRRPTTASTSSSTIDRSTDPQNQVLVREARPPPTRRGRS